ncbi:hypothetical protein H6270_004716 [Escherichia coli]|nr:hypothetical protein [Escherichia coli]
MKKALISAFVAIACAATSGSAFAGKEAETAVTLTTTVAPLSSINIEATPAAETVTVEDVKVKGTKLASLSISANNLVNTATRANIKVTVNSDNYDSARQAWLFKNGTNTIRALPSSQGWSFNGDNVTKRVDTDSSLTDKVDFNTKLGNTNVVAGSYSMPVTVSYNTW